MKFMTLNAGFLPFKGQNGSFGGRVQKFDRFLVLGDTQFKK